MTKFISRTLGVALALVVLLGLSNGADAATIEGSLTAMSGTSLPATLTVQSGTTAYTVNVTSSTTLVRQYNGPSSLDEFVLGDLLSVEGTITGTTVDATRIKNLSIQRMGGSFWGKVLSIDGTAKSFTFDPTKKKVANQTVTTSSSTKIFQGNRAGEFSDLSVGMTVKVIGLWRKSLNTLAADRVLIKLTELNGTVMAVDCASTPKMLTVSTKSKGRGTTSWTVNITDKTVIRDKNLNVIACTDVKASHKVHVRGLKTGDATLNAIQIVDRGVKKAKKTWEGSILSIDSTAKTFVIQQKKKGGDLTVTVTAETIIVNMNGKLISFSDLEVSHRLKIWGSLSGTTVTANLILDGDIE